MKRTILITSTIFSVLLVLIIIVPINNVIAAGGTLYNLLDTPIGTPTDTPIGTPTDTPIGTPTDIPTSTPVPSICDGFAGAVELYGSQENETHGSLSLTKGQPFEIMLKTGALISNPGNSQKNFEKKAVSNSIGNNLIHVLIQFYSMPSKQEVQDFSANGIRLLEYIPDNAWIATLNLNVATNIMDDFPQIRWMNYLEPEQKIAPELNKILPSKNNKEVLLFVHTFEDISSSDAQLVLSAKGANVIEAIPETGRYQVLISANKVDSLAMDDAIQWIDFGPPPKVVMNDCARWRTNVDIVQDSPFGLTGAGVNLGIWDGGQVDTHTGFSGRLTIVDTGASVEQHASHVAGTMAGDGSGSEAQGGTALQWAGMAPGANIFSWDWFSNITNHNAAINTYGVQVSQNSWGYVIKEDYNNCSLYGDYNGEAVDYDRIINGLYGNQISVIFSSGNERNDGDCGMSSAPPYLNYANVGPPGTAKNVITVGATNSNDDSMTIFSSWGPVDDGRLKPEVVAPGCESMNEGYIKSTLFNDTYGAAGWCGTSMSAPVVSGIAALIYEDFNSIFGRDPLPSTVKALLIQSAVDLDNGTSYYNPGPDFASGYGRVDAQTAIIDLRSGRVLEGSIETAGLKQYTFSVSSGQADLKISLVWDDKEGSLYANPSLVNNLDLRLVSPGGTTYRPWVLDPANPSNNATTGIDNINNVEQVYVSSPEEGTWTAYVSGTTVIPAGQTFSLVGQNLTEVDTCKTLTTIVSPGGEGTIVANPTSNCTGGKYSYGTQVELTANTTGSLSFGIWSGNASGTSNPVTVTMDSDKSVTAIFYEQTFGDVAYDDPLRLYIQSLWDNGYTAGCTTDPLMFCPDTIMDRAQSAVFMLRGQFGSDYVPPTEPWDSFIDDWSPGTWAEKWAEGMWEEGLTAGCIADPLQYCPWDELPREQAAVFGLRMMHGMAYVPPAASGTVFADMTDTGYWATKWAEQAYLDDLLPECDDLNGTVDFCPSELVSRGWGAYLIVKAKNLPLE